MNIYDGRLTPASFERRVGKKNLPNGKGLAAVVLSGGYYLLVSAFRDASSGYVSHYRQMRNGQARIFYPFGASAVVDDIEPTREEGAPKIEGTIPPRLLHLYELADAEFKNRAVREARKIQEEREAARDKVFAEGGRIQRLSGRDGMVFEVAPEKFVVESPAGKITPACCWANAAYQAHPLIRGRGPENKHSPDCPSVTCHP